MEWFSGRLEIWFAHGQSNFAPSAVYHDVSSKKAQDILDACKEPISSSIYYPAPISMEADPYAFLRGQIAAAKALHDELSA